MGKVLSAFSNGVPGAVSRAVDDIVISLKNVGDGDVAFGAPVFMDDGGAKGFDLSAPQAFSAFLGFAVRVADKTPDVYPSGQFGDGQEGTWHPGDVMEVLVRGGIAVKPISAGSVTHMSSVRATAASSGPIGGSSVTIPPLSSSSTISEVAPLVSPVARAKSARLIAVRRSIRKMALRLYSLI